MATVRELTQRLSEFPEDMEVKAILGGDEGPYTDGDVLTLGLILLMPTVGVGIYVGQWSELDLEDDDDGR